MSAGGSIPLLVHLGCVARNSLSSLTNPHTISLSSRACNSIKECTSRYMSSAAGESTAPETSSSYRRAAEPLEITLHKKEKRLEVKFSDGKHFSYSAEYLRVHSPSADTKRIDAKGQQRVVYGRRHVGILGLQPVGNYAVRIEFDDLHQSGIYTWEYLHQLGQHKLPYMRAYIAALKQRRLSREPPRPPPRQRSQPGAGAGAATTSSSSKSRATGASNKQQSGGLHAPSASSPSEGGCRNTESHVHGPGCGHKH